MISESQGGASFSQTHTAVPAKPVDFSKCSDNNPKFGKKFPIFSDENIAIVAFALKQNRNKRLAS
jgi:hypothetical protein